MPHFPVDWVDAFTTQPFGGNACAVVYDDGALSDDMCMALVRETSLVECTFVAPSERADFRVRYFLASREIPFAGHPTIATVASLVRRGHAGGATLTLETGAGIVPVEIRKTGDQIIVSMQQVAPEFGLLADPELVAAVGGLRASDIIAPPQLASTGLPFCITVLRDHDALRQVRFDSAAMTRLAASLGYDGNDMMEPFWVTLTGATPEGDTFSRLCLAPPSPPEDPFTGSATGAMAAYVWHHGLIDTPQFTAEQGHWMNRPGQAQVRVEGPADAITAVHVAGSAHVLMSGELYL